jgi:uncharacterized protein YfaS (alpha-2-macroglobulin family)
MTAFAFWLSAEDAFAKNPRVEVESVTPSGEVSRTANLTWLFSKAVVADSLLRRAVEPAPVVFSPEIPGKFRWIAPNKLRFYPDVKLAPSTEYTAQVSVSALEPHRFTLRGERNFTFLTRRLHVSSAFLTFEYDRNLREQAKLVATIEFSHDVDPRDFIQHASILRGDSRRLPFVVTTEQPGTILELEATGIPRMADESTMELRIQRGLRPVGGNLGLSADYARPVLLPGQDDLKIERVWGVRESSQNRFVSVRFNIPVRADAAGPHVAVDPAVEFELKAVHDQLQLHGDFRRDQPYRVTIRRGLTSVDGSQLGRDLTQNVVFRQQPIDPQIGFVGNGFYLSRHGHLNLGLSTVNVRSVTLEIDKVYTNNLVSVLNAHNLASPNRYSYYGARLESIGRRVHEEELQLPVHRDEEVVTPIPIETYLGDSRIGIFRVTARETERRWRSETRWVAATDLGLIAKQAGNDLWVWVNSLSTMRPVRGAKIRLYSQNNQELATTQTNSEGIGILSNYTQFSEEFKPYVITAAADDDLSFLELTRRRLSTSDFDVGGLPYLASGYEAFLYNERGVYRPGEMAHLAVIVRGPRTSVPEPFPVILKIVGPDRKILSEQRTRLNEQGGAAFEIPVPDYVLTGRYTATLMLGENQEIGRTTFSVEEFVPDRMKVRVELDRTAYRTGDEMQITVEGTTLYGPPAAGRRVQSSVHVEPFPFAPDAYRSFTFGDPDLEFTTVKADLNELTLDDEGLAHLKYTLSSDLKPPASLRAAVQVTVLEAGGRGVSSTRHAVVHAYDSYVGLRASRDGYAEPGKPYSLDFVVLDSEENPLPHRSLEVSLYSISWHTIWQRSESGRYQYTSKKYETLESTATLTSSGDIGRFEVTPEQYGAYRLVVEDPQSGIKTAWSFYSSGWGDAPWSLETADRVQLELDKEQYQPGEVANLLVRAPFPGKLLLTIERERIFDHRVVTLEGNTATIDIPVSEELKPNVYVSAHLIRSTAGLDRDDAARAFGVTPLLVDAVQNRLPVELDAPSEMRPRNQLTVDFQIGKESRAFVTIAAVDEGITQLTDFQAPDPHAFFFGKKRLGIETYDIYGVVLPEVASTLYSLAGDAETARKQRVGPVAAKRVKPVSLWSGIVETGEDGRGHVAFDVPQFNGTLRVMAVAYADDRVGHAERKVLVRDPIVLTPTFPRFASSGDHFVVPVTVLNATGVDAVFEVQLEADGPVQLQGEAVQTVRIANGREEPLYFGIRAEETLGKATFRLSARGGGQTTETEVELPVRPPVPFTTLAAGGSVQDGAPASFTFPDEFLPGTADYELVVSPFPAVRFSGSLQYLLRYPHGCIEQTTSRVFPLLAFNDIARLVEPGLFASNDADYFIEEGIAKLERMQLASGAFAYWPGGMRSSTWSTVYASHFLVEARQAGYVVSDRVYDAMLDALASIARENLGSDRAKAVQATYAVYVLALAGEPERSSQLYLKNNALETLPLFARYQLAGALAHSGERAAARQLLPLFLGPPSGAPKRETGGNFNSGIRSRAIMLDVLAEIDPGSPHVPVLVEELSRSAESGRWYTTQENAYAFLALGKILRTQSDTEFEATLQVGDEPVSSFGPQGQRFASPDWGGLDVVLQIDGTGTCYYYWRATGLPASLDVDEYDHDLVVRREYLTRDGIPLPNNTSFEQGDLVIAKLTLKAKHEKLENVAVVDLLPAGFEVENPRLQSRAGIDWIAQNAYRPDQMDVRDDRIVLYGDLDARKEESFYYGLRVVTSGSFSLPPVRAEAMYAPAKASVSGSGRVVVLEAGAAEPVPDVDPESEGEGDR